MYKLRVTYSKSKEAKYISHLDLIKVIERTFRRLDIKLIYSKGYNPRPDITFAAPLAVGIESIGELFEIMLEERLDITFLVKSLNKELPSGIIILNAEYVAADGKNIMSRAYASIYEIRILDNEKEMSKLTIKQKEELKQWYKQSMEEYLEQSNILVLKKSKNRMERIDIKPGLIDYEFLIDGGLKVSVYTGQDKNVKPDNIMIGYIEYIGKKVKYEIKRIKILIK